jgi:2-polyprenyl-3-methyl-5-hydroxy-6-metoxy-1,4-benzoquinol methylase
MIRADQTHTVERTLAAPAVHLAWEQSYRHSLNERFYEMAFDRLVDLAQARPGATFLDVGCGPGYHSMRLARRGFRVVGVDFSESALGMARYNIAAAGLEDRIVLRRENLLSLSFADRQFDFILCWGVLMHIPDIKRAMTELSRVLNAGGTLIIAEGNSRAPEARLRRAVKRWLRPGRGRPKDTPAGIEIWADSPAGPYMTRIAEIGYLIGQFEQHGLRLRHHLAHQFSEMYTRLPGRWLKRLVHALNAFYFLHIQDPRPAMGNLLVLQKMV